MEQIIHYIGLVFFSVIVGLLGIFYRNILKMDNMILSPLYEVFRWMVKKNKFLKWIAYPLGFCIYCNTTWIAIAGYYLIYNHILSFDIFVPIAISHYIAAYYCKRYSVLPGFRYEPKKAPETTDWVSDSTDGLAEGPWFDELSEVPEEFRGKSTRLEAQKVWFEAYGLSADSFKDSTDKAFETYKKEGTRRAWVDLCDAVSGHPTHTTWADRAQAWAREGDETHSPEWIKKFKDAQSMGMSVTEFEEWEENMKDIKG